MADYGVEVVKSERMLTYPNGGSVAIFSADNIASIRGQAFKFVWVDEAPLIPPDAWSDAIEPTLADYDGDALLTGTPKGKNWFYYLFAQAQLDQTVYMAAFTAPTNANPLPNIQTAFERAKVTVSDRTFRQEWLAQFLDDGGGIFRNVRAVSTLQTQGPIAGHAYVFGVDWALSNDYTVLTVYDATAKREVLIDRWHGVEYSLQRARVEATVKRYNNAQGLGEANAMGKGQNDELRKRGVRIRDFYTTNVSKADIIEDLSADYENGRWAAINDPACIAEMESFESTRLPGGGVRYAAPEGMHDDTVISKALARHAATGAGTGVFL